MKGDKVAVAGLGGLGHMAFQYAVPFGTEVTVFNVCEGKRQDAFAIRAAKYVNVNNESEMQGLDNTYRSPHDRAGRRCDRKHRAPRRQ